jgi:hypothetical protein
VIYWQIFIQKYIQIQKVYFNRYYHQSNFLNIRDKELTEWREQYLKKLEEDENEDDDAEEEEEVEEDRRRRKRKFRYKLLALSLYDKDHPSNFDRIFTPMTVRREIVNQYKHLITLFPFYLENIPQSFFYDPIIYMHKKFIIIHEVYIDHTLIQIPYIWAYLHNEDLEDKQLEKHDCSYPIQWLIKSFTHPQQSILRPILAIPH